VRDKASAHYQCPDNFTHFSYVDAELSAAEAHDAYYDSQLPRLRQLKKKFDPYNIFRFKHSIVPVD
jgi:FAD/FMN-containing dehydrogenase